MSEVTYEISTTEIKNYVYRTPHVSHNPDGKLDVQYLFKDTIYIKKIIFLNLVGREASGKIVSYTPLEHVNNYILSHHVDRGIEESLQYSKALTHYFSYLMSAQKQWDSKYKTKVNEGEIAPPRPEWNCMAFRKAEKITFQYRKALRANVLKETNPKLRLKRSTASAYIRAVINFYKFHIRNGYVFNNPPFEYEILTITVPASESSMKQYMKVVVETSDMRLNFPKSKRNEGGSLPSSRRELKPLEDNEWKEIESILLHERRVLKTVKGELKLSSLAVEYCLFFLLLRYTGLRKEEAASLHLGQIIKPSSDHAILRLGVGADYGSLTKTKDGYNKSRKTIIPAKVMQLLFEYSRTDRYQKRLLRYRELCDLKKEEGKEVFFEAEDGADENKSYLFISATGVPFFMKLTELNSRWHEIKTTVNTYSNLNINSVIHNLRSTFGVSLFRALLKKVEPDIALAMVSECFGHEDLDTTIQYLKLAQELPTGDEIYEDILEYLKVFDELEKPSNTEQSDNFDGK